MEDNKTSEEEDEQLKSLNESLGTLSLIAYLLGTSLTIWSFFAADSSFVSVVLHLVIVFVAGFGVDKYHYEVWWRGCLLGVILSGGIFLSSSYTFGQGLYYSLGWYVVCMSLFHYLEYLVTALTNPINLSTDSYLLNHSVAYTVAALAGLTEYFLEMWWFPNMKQYIAISLIGKTKASAW